MSFAVYVKGRETAIARFEFQALAEEEARAESDRLGRETYVIDERRSAYDPPVYRVRR